MADSHRADSRRCGAKQTRPRRRLLTALHAVRDALQINPLARFEDRHFAPIVQPEILVIGDEGAISGGTQQVPPEETGTIAHIKQTEQGWRNVNLTIVAGVGLRF